eukprot:2607438-Prymnesium_polylepis.1
MEGAAAAEAAVAEEGRRDRVKAKTVESVCAPRAVPLPHTRQVGRAAHTAREQQPHGWARVEQQPQGWARTPGHAPANTSGC